LKKTATKKGIKGGIYGGCKNSTGRIKKCEKNRVKVVRRGEGKSPWKGERLIGLADGMAKLKGNVMGRRVRVLHTFLVKISMKGTGSNLAGKWGKRRPVK